MRTTTVCGIHFQLKVVNTNHTIENKKKFFIVSVLKEFCQIREMDREKTICYLKIDIVILT